MNLINEIPCWYKLIAIIWASYQGFRGAVEHWKWNKVQESEFYNWIVLYIHDFVFRFVCTIAGFTALYVSYWLFPSTKEDLISLSTGGSTLIASSFIIGVIGVGGQLHYIILMGKVGKEVQNG